MENVSRKNQKKPEIKIEISAGGLVYNKNLDQFLLIKDSYGRWALPKGKLEPGETEEQAAIREIGEETGLLRTEVIKKLGQIEYYYQIHGQPIHKYLHLFLLETTSSDLIPSNETKGARWLSDTEVINKFSYKNTKKLVVEAILEIKKRQNG